MKNPKFSKEIDVKEFLFLSKYALLITSLTIALSTLKKLLLGY